ncbi:response regulator transcription factor [Marinobacter daepoensis]|uniref:Response regulator transcription factor n=1 Tax=Marinobacter daepoensis TaxID=262077 RepID=A0ABS3BF15_9GAMM|nr:response regulator transcription factor [Marinobacter daepoensis]MBN7770431.1 response regulator transcription factor [Marinobacter daepoensis]MBY6079877.1 response regulator transcription factor [Marinobacter daepoensis]
MKLMIVDDHQVVRQGIANLLRSLLPAVAITEIENGQEAVARYGELRPDVVLLDVGLPDISGLEVGRRIRQRWRGAAILFFTMHDELPMVRQALDVGGLGFVSKSCAPEELAEAVKRVAAGQPYIEHPIATRLAMNRERPVDHRLKDMTQREMEVLLMYVRGESVTGIAKRLCVSNKTVSNHLAGLKSKLQVASSVELIHLAVDAGLIRYGQLGESRRV